MPETVTPAWRKGPCDFHFSDGNKAFRGPVSVYWKDTDTYETGWWDGERLLLPTFTAVEATEPAIPTGDSE